MIRKFTLIAAAVLVAGSSAMGQRLKEGYFTWPSSQSLNTYITAWNSNGSSISGWEDENFFISRVKPRTRLVNRNVQIYSTITATTDKRYINWVPYGNETDNGIMTNALQNGNFDQECFTMWSYLDHWGDWTSPYGWVPGSLADVAHKNGVAVSGVASVPNSAISSEWLSCFNGVTGITHNNVAKFLYFHGVDGLGYNSEWTSGLTPTALISLHNDIMTYMNGKNPIYENVWYGGVNDNGSCSFDSGLTNNTKLFAGASIFLNYNWGSTISSAASTANSQSVTKNRDNTSETRPNGFWVYAGMNQQGVESGQPSNNYTLLSGVQASIGVWGAHAKNMFWQDRSNGGSSDIAKARQYQKFITQWYGNGAQNPAVNQTLGANLNHRPTDSWAGISKMVSERSTMNHTISSDPFVTYFNIGNGNFFNYKGKRVSDKSWYSLGIQDYMPTWRWWLAPTWFDKSINAGEAKLSAAFTWDDAYFGGSCIEISGTTTTEYLHLLKTQMTVARNQRVRVYYKLLEGEGEVNVVFANGSSPATMQNAVVTNGTNGARNLFDVETSANKIEASYDEGWQCCEMAFATAVNQTFNATNLRLGVIGLEFKNCKNMKMLLGGIEILPATNTTTPAAPKLTTSKVLGNTYTGVDAKLVWSMDNSVTDHQCYNSDVNTSIFKMYAQENGGEPVFVGATTSWAGFVFQAPNTDNSKTIRFGVSAVSMDMQTESEITWSSYMSKGTYTPSDEFKADKSIIKPGEAFEIAYVDPQHGSATWKLTDLNGNTVASGTGTSLSVPNGISTVGGYDLTVTYNGTSTTYGYYVQITSEASGAVPAIYTLTRGNTDVTDGGSEVTIKQPEGTKSYTLDHALTYTGRKADGSASRGLNLSDHRIACKFSDLGATSGSFSVAAWVRYEDFPSTTWKFFDITNPSAAWPGSNWGYVWASITTKGVPEIKFKSSKAGETHYIYSSTTIQPNTWTHIALVFQPSSSGLIFSLYVNGVKQSCTWKTFRSGNSGTTTATGSSDTRATNFILNPSSTDYFIFGGKDFDASNGSNNGVVDDFQVWGKAMTDAEVKESMQGYTASTVNSNIIAMWDFESDDQRSDKGFNSIGQKTIGCYACEFVTQGEGQATFTILDPTYESGCPFLSGTAYPVVTTANWSDSQRGTTFAKVASRATTEGEGGSATPTFTRSGDHTITLTLENGYGSDAKSFPVYHISGVSSAIDGIGADAEADVKTYTVNGTLFIEYGQDGTYDVQVYNAAGQLCATESMAAVAGQTSQINLSAAGVYLIRVACNGQHARTLKVLNR